MRQVLLVHPLDGIYNRVYKPWLPLSLLSIASTLVQDRYPVKIIDTRLDPGWRRTLLEAVRMRPLCVGITTMTGSQLLTAMEASRVVREAGAGTPIVWGGPHPSLFPEPTMESPLVDMLIAGEGEESFRGLVKGLEAGSPLDDVPGLFRKHNGDILRNPPGPFLDLDALPALPYHLVPMEEHLHKYFSEPRVVEVETSRGCPFSCKFCYNQLYSKRRFRAQSTQKVLDTLHSLHREYRISAFHFIDDAFFTDRDRVRRITERILEEGLRLKLGFQGVRISHINALTDEELRTLVRAGVRFVQFGVESGAPRILQLIDKKLRVEEVVETNRRLARFPEIIPLYNFMCGFPTETKEEVLESTRLAWSLLRDNPQAIVSPFHLYKHYPGTELHELAKTDHYRTPKNLREWADFDWTESIHSEKPRDLMDTMKKVETVTILADRKMEMQTDSPVIRALARLYRPVARFRLKNGFYRFMFEHRLVNAFKWAEKRRM